MSFELEVTARCNNDCRHCYINLPAGDQAARAAELTTAEIFDIAGQAVDMGAFWCLITGGEPFLREDLIEIYLGLRRLGLLVSIFTNATLIEDDHVTLLKNYPPRDMEVTVYGVTRETYERVTRRPGSFDRFLHGIDLLTAGGVPIRLKAMAVQSNLHEQGAIAEFCRARTKDFYRFDPHLNLRLDGDNKRNDEIRSERLSPEQIVRLEQSDGERAEAMREKCGMLIDESFAHACDDRLFHCGAGDNSFNIGHNGMFRLCTSLCASETLFDLRKTALSVVWRDLVPRVRDLRSQRRSFLDRCRRCSIVNLCLWCPAHSYLESGELDTPIEYFCQTAHARAAAIGSGEPEEAHR